MGDSKSPIPPGGGALTAPVRPGAGPSAARIAPGGGDSKSPIPFEAGHSASPTPPDARGVEHSGKAGSLLGITALVIADALSKITAVLLLPAGGPVRREAALQLVLSLNDLGLRSLARTLADRNDQFRWDLPKAVALFALAGAVLFVRRFPHRRSTRFWFLVAVAIFALTSAVSVVLAEITPSGRHRTAVLLTRAGQSALWLTLWSIGAAGGWRTPPSVTDTRARR